MPLVITLAKPKMSFPFVHPLFLFIAVVILLLGSSAIGYRLASATRINDVTHHHEQITGLRDGLFVLLGLLLGFTIAMVLPRFDRRQDLVVEEANAIRRTMLRAQVLPEPERNKTLELLREYVIVRADFTNVKLADAALNRNIEQTRALQDELWRQAVDVTQQNQTAVVASYLSSLSDAIDVADLQLAFLEHRVPKQVWIILIMIGVFQSFVAGYNLKQNFWLVRTITPLVIASVLALIVDLDSPRTGFIHTDQRSIQRLVKDVSAPAPLVIPKDPQR